MSARSSSGSWSGAGRAPPDIIDLDKFMRGAVRPARTDGHTLRWPVTPLTNLKSTTTNGDKLVVDAGGVDRKPGAQAPPAPAPASPVAPAPSLTVPSDSSGSRPRPHGKRFSHDSGLSDTSYARRKHRSHRRAVGGDNNGVRASRTPAAGSSDSLRAFRAVCERALLDQQAQIARVAELCERLSERPPPRRRSDRSTDTSEVSSSSRSTRDQRRKDKHRIDECKTYKIIMNKLDELNRLFAARARSPPPAARSPPPAPRRLPASSGSVSVSDKLVSTEPEGPERPRELQVALNAVTIRGGSTYGACGSCGAGAAGGAGGAAGAGGAGGSCGAGGSSRLAGLRTVTNTCALDIAPRQGLPRHNIATERVVQCESREGTGTSSGDPRCGFDLDDPVHLYSQAKRLQAMSATTRRTRSVEPSTRRFDRFEPFEPDEHSQRSQLSQRAHSHERASAERPREPSLCSLCRGYWRSLTHYLAAQIFCCPDAAVR